MYVVIYYVTKSGSKCSIPSSVEKMEDDIRWVEETMGAVVTKVEIGA